MSNANTSDDSDDSDDGRRRQGIWRREELEALDSDELREAAQATREAFTPFEDPADFSEAELVDRLENRRKPYNYVVGSWTVHK